jgi:general secretion pathway protein J
MKRRRTRARSAEFGFTLLETLIATALMAAVLAALATVTAQWLPNWNRGFDHVQRTALFALGIERTVADVAAAQFVAPNRGTKNPLFEGTEVSVTFVRSVIGPNSRPGLEIIRIAETADERGLVLVRMRAPFAPSAPEVRPVDQARFSDPVVLMRTPYRMSFSYAGPDRIWQDKWVDAEQLPSAIRLRIRDAGSEQTLSMSTATLIHAEIPVDCILPQANIKIDCGEARPPQSNPGNPGTTVSPGTVRNNAMQAR